MDSEVLHHDPVAGITEEFHFDETFDRIVHSVEQDVTDIVEANKARFADVDERAPMTGEMHLVASIPMSIYNDLMQKGIIYDQKALSKWLNDPDNRVFRVRPGRV